MSAILDIWKGEAVAVFATGPSLARKALKRVRDMRAIAVKASFQLIPWAEMVVCHDRSWWETEVAQGFEGIRVSGQEGAPNTVFVRGRHERVELTPGHIVEIASSGLLAVRVAAMTGPARIELHGFDGGPSHWQPDRPPRDPIVVAATAKALDGLIVELRERGIDVEMQP